MRTTSWMRAHSIPSRGFVPAALCGGAWLLLVWSGCAGGPPSEEDAPFPAGVEETVSAETLPVTPTEAFSAPDSAPGRVAEGAVARKIRDASLAARVQLALAGTRGLRAHAFDPQAADGHVILRGHVATWAQRERAAAVAAGVSGVTSVANELTSTEQRPAALAEAAGGSGNVSNAAPDGAEDRPPEREALPGGGAEGPAYHTVARGESLWTISRRYDVRVDRIKALNGLTSDAISAGQQLRIR